MFSVPYFLIVILWQILGLKLGFPAVDYYIQIDFLTAVFHIGFVISGTALILIVAKKLERIKFLKLFGRQSLFVYLMHSFVVCGLMKLYSSIFQISNFFLSGMCFYLTIYVLSIIILLCGCKLVESNRFSWMVGKF